jgi:hypothetical protein
MHKRNEKLHIADTLLQIGMKNGTTISTGNKRSKDNEIVCKGCKNGLMHAK